MTDENCNDGSMGDDREGFTLVEILIALVVVAVGLLSLAYMHCTAVKGNTLSEKYTQATFLAQGMLEQIKNGQLVNGDTFRFINMADAATGEIKDSGVFTGINERGGISGPFTIRWQAATHTAWSRRVTIVVSWRSVLGQMQELKFESTSRGEGN